MSVLAPPASVVRLALPSIEDFIRRVFATAWFFPSLVATSWWRDAAANRFVGGAEFSQHLIALALDVVVPRAEVQQLLNVARFFGLTAVDEGTHVHLQLFPAGRVPQAVFRSV